MAGRGGGLRFYRRRNSFDTAMRAVSLRTLFAGTRWSHGRSNCKFDAALGLLNLRQRAKPVCRLALPENGEHEINDEPPIKLSWPSTSLGRTRTRVQSRTASP